jgi:predicted nucleotidyltransferase
MTRTEILTCLASHRRDLDRYGVHSLALFGSAARDEVRPDSDVDVLVEFARPVGLLTFITLQMDLEQWLGRRVDLVTPDALPAAMRATVLAEAVHAA